MNTKQLKEQRNEAVGEIQRLAELANDSESWSSEQEERWDKVNAEYDKLSDQLNKAERAETISLSDIKADTTYRPASYSADDAFMAWSRASAGQKPLEGDRDAMEAYGVSPGQREFEFYAASTTSTNSELVPTQFSAQYEKALKFYGGIRNVASVFSTAGGGDLHFPTLNDTSNKGVIVGENQQVGEQNIGTDEIVFKDFKYTSKMIPVSYELLQDNIYNLAGELATIAGERIARAADEHFVQGSGTGEPQGIVPASSLGVTAASTTKVKATEVYDLVYSVDRAYRGNAVFVMSDNAIASIRKLQDSNGQFLWTPALTEGETDRLAGYRVVVSNFMDDVATGNKPVLFGDVSKYRIRNIGGIRVRRLTERYADYDREAFIAFHRMDGRLMDAGTNPVKHMKMA